MIRKATPKDIDAIEALYNELFTYEETTKNWSNWQRGIYPTRATAEKTVDLGTMYVLEETGMICASMILNDLQGDFYKEIPWQYPAKDDEVAVIHTLCVSPSQSGKGYASQMLTFAKEQAKERGCKVIRMDTYSGNDPAKALYQKKGFRIVGYIDTLLEGLIAEELAMLEIEL
ncbi:MAG: GNAT family N-acetyltransferase [Firmicutes bacterium]|nr:GNAT family N-acetyltransferase [Bacillota bacterium]